MKFRCSIFDFGLLAAVLALSACKTELPPPLVVAAPPAQAKTLSQVSAAVGQLREDNQKNPDGPAKQAVDLQARIAQAGLAKPTEADARNAAETSALVFAGKLAAAEARAAKAEGALAQLRQEWQAEQAAAKSRIDQLIADYEARLAAAQAAAERAAYVRVVSIFAIIGGAVTLIGIGCAVTGWSRIGILCIPSGIIIGGSGLLWGKPWFIWTVGGGVLLCAIAGGIFWAVRVLEGGHPLAKATPAPAPQPLTPSVPHSLTPSAPSAPGPTPSG